MVVIEFHSLIGGSACIYTSGLLYRDDAVFVLVKFLGIVVTILKLDLICNFE